MLVKKGKKEIKRLSIKKDYFRMEEEVKCHT